MWLPIHGFRISTALSPAQCEERLRWLLRPNSRSAAVYSGKIKSCRFRFRRTASANLRGNFVLVSGRIPERPGEPVTAAIYSVALFAVLGIASIALLAGFAGWWVYNLGPLALLPAAIFCAIYLINYAIVFRPAKPRAKSELTALLGK